MNAKAPTAGSGSEARGRSATELPVREGESAWTAAELAGVRQELNDELEMRSDEIAEMEGELADLVAEGIDVAGDDQADSGSKTMERDNEMALLGKTREMHKQVARALARLDEGTYGLCETCGEPIGKLRLQAFPRALVCLSCKQKQDRH